MKKKLSKTEVGYEGENIALQYLLNLGYTLLCRNWRSKKRGFGEIDLVMTKGVVIVFVEVKYRKQGCFGTAGHAIDEKKKSRLYEAASEYLATKGYGIEKECLFSAFLIDEYNGSRNISFIENIFI